jgi:hypothetical protein
MSATLDILDSLIDEEFDIAESTGEIVRVSGWPGYSSDGVPRYTNAETGKEYKPHHDEEKRFVFTDSPRYGACLGGEGGGKSVAGIIKDLERLRRGMDGIAGSPTFEHLKISLWPEFRRWCPSECVVEAERYRLLKTWEPSRPFQLHLKNQYGGVSTCYFVGTDDPKALEGPNLTWGHLDEARKRDKPDALKVLDGRCRIPGPSGEPPQLYLTTTPEMHWLYDYFGPLKTDEPDPLEDFKRDSLVIRLLTIDNELAGNVAAGYTRQRGQSLTEAEKRVLLLAEWEDLNDGNPFLESMQWWDDCKESLPPLSPYEPLVAAMDAGISDDPFALVGVGRHHYREGVLCPRLIRLWPPEKNRKLDFDRIQSDIEELKDAHNILVIHYDPYQLHQMGTRLRRSKVVHTAEFKQGGEINAADKGLLDLITQKKVAWSPGDENSALLYQHLKNADRKLTEDKKMRLVKRTASKKIDLARALSMACHRGARLWKRQVSFPRTSAHADYR